MRLSVSVASPHAARRPDMTPSLRRHVAEYGASHRHPVNRALHALGIPLLGVGTLGLLSALAVPAGVGVDALEPNAGLAALALATGWYLWHDRRLGVLGLAVVVGCYAVGSVLSGWLLAGLWVAGALVHLVGHVGYEGKPPSTLSKPQSVFAAPVWLLCWLAGTLPGEGEP